MPTLLDAQAQAYKLANPDIPFNPDAAIAKKWLQEKAAGRFYGVPIGAELQLGTVDGQPRASQSFTGGAVFVWYGGSDVRIQ